MQTVEGGGTVRVGKFCKRLVIKNSKGCALPIIQEKHFYSDRRTSFHRQSSTSFGVGALAAAIGGGGGGGGSNLNLSPTVSRRLQPKSHGMLTGDTK